MVLGLLFKLVRNLAQLNRFLPELGRLLELLLVRLYSSLGGRLSHERVQHDLVGVPGPDERAGAARLLGCVAGNGWRLRKAL